MKYLGLALLPLMAAMTTAQAESAFDPQGQYLLGDWNGQRTELAQQGIKFEANLLTDTPENLLDCHRNGFLWIF